VNIHPNGGLWQVEKQLNDFDRLARLPVPVALPGSLTAARAGLAKLALTKDELTAEAKKVDPNPTEAQKESGNYKKGRVEWKGLPLVIETAKGQVRKGKNYETLLKDHYGYVAGTTSDADTDPIDVFLCEDNLDSEIIFIVNQRKKDGGFDEHKCILGCISEAQARDVYLRNYSPGWKGLGSITAITLDHFKWWLENADTSKEVLNGYFAARENLKQKKTAADHGMNEYDCPYCGGTAYPGDPDTGTLFRGSGKCTACGKGFSIVGLKLKPRVKVAEGDVFTVACDLDGTLAHAEEPFNPKTIGEPRKNALKAMTAFRKAGARLIIFTVRGDTELVKGWLEKHKIPFDYINENPDQPPDSSGKVFAHLYWDDRGVNAKDDDSWEEVLELIEEATKEA